MNLKQKLLNSVRKTRLHMVFLAVLGFALAAVLLLFVFQNKLLYFPRRYASTFVPGEGETAQFHAYRTINGAKNWGYLIKPADGSTTSNASPRPRFYMVYNGNGTVAMDTIELFEDLAEQTGCGFFIADYTGYGFNEGVPTEAALVSDALGAYDTMKSEGFLDHGIGVLGHSMGGGAAYTVTRVRPVDRLITLSTYTSVDAMANKVLFWGAHLLSRNHWRNDEILKELVSRPPDKRPKEIYIMHAREDRLIPIRMAEELARIGGDAVTYIPVEEAGHDNVLDIAQPKVAEILMRPVDSPAQADPSQTPPESGRSALGRPEGAAN